MTKDEKEKTHVDAIIERYKDLMVEIPPPTSNPVSPCSGRFPPSPPSTRASARPRTGLPTRSKASFWTAFAFGRDSLPTPMQKTAFEVAFLTRLQQRLVAARRSG